MLTYVHTYICIYICVCGIANASVMSFHGHMYHMIGIIGFDMIEALLLLLLLSIIYSLFINEYSLYEYL